MKTRYFALTMAAILFCPTSATYAGSSPPIEQPQIGVLLDTEPLPELLTKHLGLSPDQGICIQNIRADSPADRAGLERDDIIISLEGNQVKDFEEFANKIRQTDADTELNLEVIHLGKRKTIKLKPEVLEGEVIWKYPPEPHTVQSWQPGKLFHLKPDDKGWLEVLPDKMPDIQLNEFFKKIYTYQYSKDGENYTITIEGNPNDKNAEVTIRTGKTEHKTTIEEMDKLPEKYLDSAKNALQKAREANKHRKFLVPSPPMPETWRYFFDREGLNRFPGQPLNPDNRMLEKMEEQMRQLQERIEQLEKQQQKLPEQSPQKPDKQEDKKQEQEIQLRERV